MFQCSQQIGVVSLCKRYWILSVSIGNHRQVYYERGLLCLKVCKLRSASGIELEIMTFRKSLLRFFVLSIALFFRGQKIFRYRFPQVTAYRGTGLAKVQHVRLCCEHAGFYCEGLDCLWAAVSIHRETSSAVVSSVNKCMETSLYVEVVEKSSTMQVLLQVFFCRKNCRFF